MNFSKEALYQHLSSFMSEERTALFDKVLDERTRYVSVILEDIFQPHNASAVLRSCDCFGIQDVHITEEATDYSVNKGVSLGAWKWLSLHKYGSEKGALQECYSTLRSAGYAIVATTPADDSMSISEIPLDKPIAMAFGTELLGLTPEAIEGADYKAHIPMRGFTESFNLSVAAAISLKELSERVRSSSLDWGLSEEEKLELKIDWAKKTIRKSDFIVERYMIEHERD